jgi:hypothetical protein
LRRPELHFEFLARYEVSVLDRIRRAGAALVLSFPGAVELDDQREVSAGVVVEVVPAEGEPWVGVFEFGRERVPPAARRQVIGWPDERSICVVQGGGAWVVRSDDPTRWYEVDAFPVTDVLVVPSHELVVFADFTEAEAYGPEGLVWRTGRVAVDDLTLVEAVGDELRVTGFAGATRHHPFVIDLRTGAAVDPAF